jgi:hypothetical protein
MKPRITRFLFWTGIAVAAYFMLYFSSVQAVTYKSAGPVTPRPSYGWPSDGDFTHSVFAPAHLIDATFLRRGYWAPISPRTSPNQAAAPNRRLMFAFAALFPFDYRSCVPPASSAAVGEPQR